MSTLTVQNISNGSVSTSSANVIQGCAKAWVNFNGTGTVAIRASYNVTSITDNGTGDYAVNFTNALSDANYVAIALPIADVTGFGSSPIKLGSTPTTSTVSFRPVNNNTYYDASILSVAIFR